MDVKDLLRREVGGVNHVHFIIEGGKFSGLAKAEFESATLAKEAIKKMNNFEFKGCRLVVGVST
jgi:hypothetical protein